MTDAKTFITTLADVNAQVKALRKCPTFTVTRDHSAKTVKVTHPGAGVVYRAMGLTRATGRWLVTHKVNLFS